MYEIAIVVVLAIAFLVIRASRKSYASTSNLANIEVQFREFRRVGGDSRASFVGSEVTIVSEFVDEPKAHGRRSIGHPIILHRICRNSYGEYFLYISGDQPYLAHMNRERAMHALRADPVSYKREFGMEP